MTAHRDDSRDVTERSVANRAASEWVILLQEAPDDRAVRAKFDEWLNASSVHRDAWAETQRISHVVRTTPPSHANRWRRSPPSIVPFDGRKRMRRGVQFAAAAAAEHGRATWRGRR